MNFSIKNPEISRKLVHLSSLIYPILYYYTDQIIIVTIILIVLALNTLWDLLRIFSKNKFIQYTNNIFTRGYEKKSMSGGFYFMLSCLIASLFFSKYLFIVSICILIIADTSAALIGINYGKHKILNKSLEGSIAFFVSGFITIIVINFIFNLPLINIILIISLFFATIFELFQSKLKLDDNLIIVLVFAIVYKLLILLSVY